MDSRATLAVPLLIITVGSGWLLTNLGVVPGIDWIWTLGLGMVGIATFILAGYNKLSTVVGSFFVIASFVSVLRQTGQLAMNIEVPLLVISLGALMFIARSRLIPVPEWILPIDGEPRTEP